MHIHLKIPASEWEKIQRVRARYKLKHPTSAPPSIARIITAILKAHSEDEILQMLEGESNG